MRVALFLFNTTAMDKDTTGASRKATVGFNVKAATDEGILEAIVSVFGNRDSYDEAVIFGAFAKSLANKLPKGVWAHDWMNPIATTLEALELPAGHPLLPDSIKANGGLYIKAQFYKEITDSWQAFLKIKNGLVDEFSIGYRNVRVEYDNTTDLVKLLEVDLYEWSPVLVGANRATEVLSIKSALSFTDDLAVTQEVIEKFAGRVKDRKEHRETQGRKAGASFSATHKERILGAADSLITLATDLRDMVAATEAQPKANEPELFKQSLELQRLEIEGLLT